MAEVRLEFRDDVEDVINNARDLANWKSYVRSYPWLCLGAAAAVGYFMVPQRLEIRSPDVATLEKLAKRNKLVVDANPDPTPRSGWLNTAAVFLGSLAVRQAMALAGQKLGVWLGELEQSQGSASPSSAAARENIHTS
jgi:hypothetical protein